MNWKFFLIFFKEISEKLALEKSKREEYIKVDSWKWYLAKKRPASHRANLFHDGHQGLVSRKINNL